MASSRLSYTGVLVFTQQLSEANACAGLYRVQRPGEPAPKSKLDAVRAALTCHAHEQWERPKGDRDSEGSATIRDRDGNCVGGTHEWSAIDDRA